ncbi:hypothetical protein PM082_023054 [Marasmius tenuissimus]|nr:hypothetical protein PM082_023054 [Marasmius tenuissimus]
MGFTSSRSSFGSTNRTIITMSNNDKRLLQPPAVFGPLHNVGDVCVVTGVINLRTGYFHNPPHGPSPRFWIQLVLPNAPGHYGSTHLGFQRLLRRVKDGGSISVQPVRHHLTSTVGLTEPGHPRPVSLFLLTTRQPGT